MPFVPVPNGAEVRVLGTYGEQQIVNVLHYLLEGPITDVMLGALALAVNQSYTANLIPVLSSVFTLQEVRARSLEGEGTLQVTNTAGLPLPGAVGAEAASPQDAVVITQRTGLIGRSYRGRTYFCGFTEGNIGNGSALAALITACVTTLGQIRVPGTTGNPRMAVLSRQFNGNTRPVPVLTPVTLIESRNSFLGTMRSRSRRA